MPILKGNCRVITGGVMLRGRPHTGGQMIGLYDRMTTHASFFPPTGTSLLCLMKEGKNTCHKTKNHILLIILFELTKLVTVTMSSFQ